MANPPSGLQNSSKETQLAALKNIATRTITNDTQNKIQDKSDKVPQNRNLTSVFQEFLSGFKKGEKGLRAERDSQIQAKAQKQNDDFTL